MSEKMKIGFTILTEFLKYQQVYTLLKMIEAARAKNHTVLGIFCFGTGVLNLNTKHQFGKTIKNVPSALAKLTALGIPIYACQTWADNYGIFKDNCIEGAQIAGLGELSTITFEADKMIVFGSHT